MRLVADKQPPRCCYHIGLVKATASTSKPSYSVGNYQNRCKCMERGPRETNLAFSAFHMGLLRSNFIPAPSEPSELNASRNNEPNKSFKPGFFGFNPMLGAFQPYATVHFPTDPILETKTQRHFLNPLGSFCHKRSRGEKKAIPDEQKDDRYFERRKRNNQAAKKSRDARKLREDQIALRAAILEHENAMMRAQILTLREETEALRSMLMLSKKPSDQYVRLPKQPEKTN